MPASLAARFAAALAKDSRSQVAIDKSKVQKLLSSAEHSYVLLSGVAMRIKVWLFHHQTKFTLIELLEGKCFRKPESNPKGR